MARKFQFPDSDKHGPIGHGRFASASSRPGSIAELQAAVRAAVADGLAVYPQGGGTALDFGGPPGRPGAAIHLDRLDRIVDYPAADMTITVEAGISLAAVRELVAAQGQRLAIEAAFPDRATLGGIFATAATGPRRFGWGRPRDQVIGIAFVDAAGRLIRGGGRVVKNVAGYDFPKLMTGSLGTLGIIAELTLKTSPRPESSAQVRVAFDSLAEAAAALDRLNLSGTRPVTLELVDDGPAAGWTFLVGLEGNRAAVDWQVARLGSELGRGDLPILRDAEADAAWLDFVQDEAEAPGPLAFAASFAPSAALRFLEAGPRDRWSTRTHAGNGVVRGVARLEADRDWKVEVDRLRLEAGRLGGSVMLTRCPIQRKPSLDVWGPRRPDWAIAERVKAALDPGHVLNPGRFVGTI